MTKCRLSFTFIYQNITNRLIDPVMKPKPLVSVLSNLTKLGEDQQRRKSDFNDEVIDFDYSNSVHSYVKILNSYLNRIVF